MTQQLTEHVYITVSAVLPDSNGGFTPCPELLTEVEAIRYLRLDTSDASAPGRTLKYYRDRGELVAIKVGKWNRYRRQDLDNFLADKSEEKQRRLASQAKGLTGVNPSNIKPYGR
jgi:hypothetical protein